MKIPSVAYVTGSRSVDSTMNDRLCVGLEKNLYGEQEVFMNGMSLKDVIDAYVHHQPFWNHREWTTGYCTLQDWYVIQLLVGCDL